MGVLTRMTWPESTLLQVLEDAEQNQADTFDIVCLELNDGRTFKRAQLHQGIGHQPVARLTQGV